MRGTDLEGAMELAELITYARNRYGIPEERKWADFPGFSVLRHPKTGKWVVLCIRQWDGEIGEFVEVADIKCGASLRFAFDVPYLTAPFRMKGEQWLGVRFGPEVSGAVVRDLLDRALGAEGGSGFTVVVDDGAALRGAVRQTEKPQVGGKRYADTPLPERRDAARERSASVPTAAAARKEPAPEVSRVPDVPLTFELPWGGSVAKADGQFALDLPGEEIDVPERISRMMRLYDAGDGTSVSRARNFVVQGRFMEGYADEGSWPEPRRIFYPTYHDLGVGQLRGFFSWRTKVRAGEWTATCTAYAYLYIYELLNGIGAKDVEDRLGLLGEFAASYPEEAAGVAGIRENLTRWMFELAMAEGLPVERVRELAPKPMMDEDRALAVLRNAATYPDEAVFAALDRMGQGKLSKSIAVQKHPEEAKALFAVSWRNAQVPQGKWNRTLFELCFGGPRMGSWRPLGNAVYLHPEDPPDLEYRISSVRMYRRRAGAWTEAAFRDIFFDKGLFAGFCHEADRQIREHLHTGRALKAMPEEERHAPFIAAAIADAERMRVERARAKVEIDFLNLARIRDEAGVTRDSLIVDEDDWLFGDAGIDEALPFEEPAQIDGPAVTGGIPSVAAPEVFGLSPSHAEILRQLMAGQSAEALIAAAHLTSDLVADAINEAFFDEIGDNVLEQIDGALVLVEDYREDMERLMEGDA